ncbi:MAG: hypothetical protein BGN85_00340 [Alphaproteobacteria bacterium 64-11]|nr:BREX-1 system phosphatase PglZ type B [Alphaproteobacteria bacterium]OJU14322.1 MAG: hypothetical protein BGN85_00340 [Alphaproteobacteria bacterium 64-11]
MNDRTLIHGLARALIEATQSFAGEGWPAALLWPDPERQWHFAFADLRRRLASQHVALYALGDDYTPDDGIGPAIWLRCLIEAPDAPNLKGLVPDAKHSVILLPGISWRDLREPLTLAKNAQMLVDLQYRGDVFRQRRQARDWTVATFLRDPDQGLGLDVATDSRTDESARRALVGLLDLPLDGWRDKRLSADDFDGLLIEDKERDLLRWIADPDSARAIFTTAAWNAFGDQVERDFKIDLELKGALQTATERLVRRSGAWARVWNRLAAEPQQFRAVCDRIREATAPKQGNLLGMEDGDAITSPHDNAIAEKMLTLELGEVAQLPSREAAAKIMALEERHRDRRDTLWAKLGEAPLARALEPLARLAAATEAALPGDDLTAIATAYCEDGWHVDCALMETIAAAGTREDIVGRAAGALYRPWVDPLARRFRAALEAAGDSARPHPLAVEPGTLVLFVDGLRMDIGQAVAERLNNAGVPASLAWRLSPVPTLTATAKPLVTPVGDSIGGKGKVEAFQPLETSSGRPVTLDVLRRAMLARGMQVLEHNEVLAPEKPSAIGYAECGNIDNDGHNMGLRLAGQLDTEVARIADYAAALHAAGWPRVRIVTDHGWLLMPGGFEGVRLPPSAVIAKGSRAAILQEHAAAELAFLPWHWDKSVRVAVPPGAEAFRAGEVYSHGGVSPQECVIPDITVGGHAAAASSAVRIGAITWRRLRLTVEITGELTDVTVEVRRKERDPASRIDVSSTVEGARARLTISDDVEEGDPVLVVLIDRHGSVIDARATRVGDRA